MTAADTTPVWFMDIDGVLNIFPRGTPPAHTRTGEATPFWNNDDDVSTPMFPITWRTDIVDRIVALHDAGHIKVVWLTTWGRGANYSFNRLIGFPELEVVADPEDSPYRAMGWHTWWKAEALRKYISEHDVKTFVWTDDDINAQKHQLDDIFALEDTDMLIVSTSDHRGITHDNIDAVEMLLGLRDVQTDGHGI